VEEWSTSRSNASRLPQLPVHAQQGAMNADICFLPAWQVSQWFWVLQSCAQQRKSCPYRHKPDLDADNRTNTPLHRIFVILGDGGFKARYPSICPKAGPKEVGIAIDAVQQLAHRKVECAVWDACVCVCVCVCVYARVCVCVRACVCMCACVHVYMRTEKRQASTSKSFLKMMCLQSCPRSLYFLTSCTHVQDVCRAAYALELAVSWYSAFASADCSSIRLPDPTTILSTNVTTVPLGIAALIFCTVTSSSFIYVELLVLPAYRKRVCRTP